MTAIVANRAYLVAALSLIDGATSEVLVSCYKVHPRRAGGKAGPADLLDALEGAARRGVTVRMLLNCVGPGTKVVQVNRRVAARLQVRGVAVRRLKDAKIAHAKLLVVDGRVALVGSHNWSLPSLARNWEMSVLVNEPQAVGQAAAYFMAEWQRGYKYT